MASHFPHHTSVRPDVDGSITLYYPLSIQVTSSCGSHRKGCSMAALSGPPGPRRSSSRRTSRRWRRVKPSHRGVSNSRRQSPGTGQPELHDPAEQSLCAKAIQKHAEAIPRICVGALACLGRAGLCYVCPVTYEVAPNCSACFQERFGLSHLVSPVETQ